MTLFFFVTKHDLQITKHAFNDANVYPLFDSE